MVVVEGEEREPFSPSLYTYSTIAWVGAPRCVPATQDVIQPSDVISMSRVGDASIAFPAPIVCTVRRRGVHCLEPQTEWI